MLKTVCTLHLLFLSTISLSQKSKIDSVKVISIICSYDSLGNKSFYTRKREFEICSENSCLYKMWGYYLPDSSLVEYQYEFTSAEEEEKFTFYWDHSYPQLQETTLSFEKYYDENQTFKSLEILMEKQVYRNAHIKDSLNSKNVVSRRAWSGYHPNQVFENDYRFIDTTIIRISAWLEIINENGKKSLEMIYDSTSLKMKEIMDYVDGQTKYDISKARSILESTISDMENLQLEYETENDLDANALRSNFSVESHLLYNATDRKRPSYLTRRNKRLRRIKKDKNVEIWEYNYENDYEIEIIEVY